jgi:hypothetical protein
MTKSLTFTPMIVASCLTAGLLCPTAANAQANPKTEKCLLEAQGKGLYAPNRGERGAATIARSNAAMAPQRNAFMKECMKRP